MKGQILDVYPEGKSKFRACVLGPHNNITQIIRVINLETGKVEYVKKIELEAPIIFNIFEFEN